MHPSIIPPHSLIEELNLMQKTNNFKPIDNISIKNIHNIEKSISVKAYSTEATLTFILDIPSIDTNPYDLIHLYSIPDKRNLTIIPKSKYLALGSDEYSYLDEDCRKMTQGTLLCTSLNTQAIEDSDDCIIKLIKHQTPNCTKAKLHLKHNKIEKIAEDKWLVILKEEAVARKQCGPKSEYIKLIGIHIISITKECKLNILNRTLRTNAHAISVDNIIPLPKEEITTPENTPIKLTLEDIALDNVYKLLDRAEDVEVDSNIDWRLIMATPSWSTIGLYVTLITYVCWKVYQHRKKRRNTRYLDQQRGRCRKLRDALPS
ncbi:hypothetical protein K1T71_001383 [Dendrolimus kikuchii]|uniref:Uncharacterized protein n=1 Tax=Dendrolimus kikuchii TaxID=765133 RepID=A0ACC1DHP0_9NEOP|nr:hypothetical protein K1T71_001383 [Dendrolimus kikuchii]